MLGHFRHESGHYYFDRLIANSGWIEPFRALFGDERQDYGGCLQRHYQDGSPSGWEQRFVSGYASVHPWEDWAETWAHYLHMIDTLDTNGRRAVRSPFDSSLSRLPGVSKVDTLAWLVERLDRYP